MPKLTIARFESDLVTVVRYDAATHAAFREIFDEPTDANAVLQHLARPNEESGLALVLHNVADRPLAALQYVWTTTDEKGQTRTRRHSSHSYNVSVYRPVIPAGNRLLITPETMVEESVLEHVRKGGGILGSGGGSRMRGGAPIVEWHFELSVVIFEDGEIVGPDTHRLVVQLHCEHRAAEYIDEQIRLAEEQGRDARPVLEALKAFPLFNHEMMAEAVERAASFALHAPFGKISRASMRRVPLPKFYRRDK